MNTRRRHGTRNNEDGVYHGPSLTQPQLLQQADAPLSTSLPLAPPVDLGGASCRDRTTEFQSVLRSLLARQVSLLGSDVQSQNIRSEKCCLLV